MTDYGSMQNIFKSYVDSSGNEVFNLNNTLNFRTGNGDDTVVAELAMKYLVQEGDTWTNLAFRFYENRNYWWSICKINGIIDPFVTDPTPGEYIYILHKEVIDSVLKPVSISKV